MKKPFKQFPTGPQQSGEQAIGLTVTKPLPRNSINTALDGRETGQPEEAIRLEISNKPNTRRPRDRRGYVSPTRVGKILVRAYLEKHDDRELHELATHCGLSKETLLIVLAKDAIERAKIDFRFLSALKLEGRKIADIRRQAVEAAREAAATVRRDTKSTRLLVGARRFPKKMLG